MKVDLLNELNFTYEVDNSFISKYKFIRSPIDIDYFHSKLIGNKLFININPIAANMNVLDGPNGVLKLLSILDGSLAGSIIHDVIWELVKKLSNLTGESLSKIRKFGDNLYIPVTFHFGGVNFWTKLSTRFCYRVAFPFGNFVKNHNLPLPTFLAPLVVLILLVPAIILFLFNKGYSKIKLIDTSSIYLKVNGDYIILSK